MWRKPQSLRAAPWSGLLGPIGSLPRRMAQRKINRAHPDHGKRCTPENKPEPGLQVHRKKNFVRWQDTSWGIVPCAVIKPT